MSYPGHSLGGGSYSSAEKQSVYSTAPADWANKIELICLHTIIAIVSTQLNSFNYFDLTLIILFSIYHLFAHSKVVIIIAI